MLEDTQIPAVAICGVGSVGLCVEHLTENARRSGPGGMRPYACLHRPGHDRPRQGGGLAVEEAQPAKAVRGSSERWGSRRRGAALKPGAVWRAADTPGASPV